MHKAEGLTTTEDETYSTIQGKEKIKIKGKGKGKTTVKHQQIIKEEKYPIDRTNELKQTDETENYQSSEIKSHKEEGLITDFNSMRIIFLEDSVSDEVIIGDDKYMCNAMSFNINDFDDKNREVIIESNNAIENNTRHENLNNENATKIVDTHKIKGKASGMTILKEEKLEKKVFFKELKPLSLNNYIHMPKPSKHKSEKLIAKPKVARNFFNYYEDEEKIYEPLMDSD